MISNIRFPLTSTVGIMTFVPGAFYFIRNFLKFELEEAPEKTVSFLATGHGLFQWPPHLDTENHGNLHYP